MSLLMTHGIELLEANPPSGVQATITASRFCGTASSSSIVCARVCIYWIRIAVKYFEKMLSLEILKDQVLEYMEMCTRDAPSFEFFRLEFAMIIKGCVSEMAALEILEKDQYVEDVSNVVCDLIEYELCKGRVFTKPASSTRIWVHKELEVSGKISSCVSYRTSHMKDVPWTHIEQIVRICTVFVSPFDLLGVVLGLMDDIAPHVRWLMNIMNHLCPSVKDFVKTIIDCYSYQEQCGWNISIVDRNMTCLANAVVETFSKDALHDALEWLEKTVASTEYRERQTCEFIRHFCLEMRLHIKS